MAISNFQLLQLDRKTGSLLVFVVILWKNNPFQRWRLVQLDSTRVRVHSFVWFQFIYLNRCDLPLLFNKPAASAILMAGISTVVRDRHGPCELPSFCCCFMYIPSYILINTLTRIGSSYRSLGEGLWLDSGTIPANAADTAVVVRYLLIHSTFAKLIIRAMGRSLKHAMTLLFRLYDTGGSKLCWHSYRNGPIYSIRSAEFVNTQ